MIERISASFASICTVSLLLALGAGISTARAQAAAGVYPAASALEIGRRLQAELDRTKAPTGLLEQRLNDVTQVAVRVKSGRAELHQNASDVFFVLEGEATLTSGGSIVHPEGTNEIRGDSIDGGVSAAMHKGDVVYVPPSTPHQVSVRPGKAFLYIVVKVPRKD